MARIWQKTLKIIDERLGERQIFDYFFADTYIYEIVGDLVTVVTKDKTSQRLLSFNYIDLIKEAFNEVTDNNCEFKFVLLNEIAGAKAPKATNVVSNEEPMFFKNAELKEDLTFDSFVEGEFNKDTDYDHDNRIWYAAVKLTYDAKTGVLTAEKHVDTKF